MTYPDQYKYTKQHEWVHAEGDTGIVGITDHAQHELGDIVFVELPKVGANFKLGDTLGSVESVKAVSDIYCPVSGEVVEVNNFLVQNPATLNEDPHGNGWLVKLKLQDAGELNALLSPDDYQKYVGAE